ncbi:hypothetical protein KKH38_01595 [Patescibacteria group bacterium]|nr:hypothetical protein [Patescibacteria group bacterium]MBU4600711.1 hypothetical protein [Patescibacteria group bacterium]MCG2698478.1 hypothetical protein [Candidatus Parcubacteria bacterium]
MLNKIKITILLIALCALVSGCITLQTDSKSGGNDGGVFRTGDKGSSWQQAVLIPTASGKPGSIGPLNTASLVMDPNDSKAIYFGSFDNGLFYSYDRAQTWQVAAILGKGTIKAIAVDPDSKCVIYAAINNAVYKSTDCNRTWEQIYFDNDLKAVISAIAIDHYDSNNIYIGSSQGNIIKSSDRGASWRALYNIGGGAEKMIIDPHDSRVIFAASADKGIYRSKDNGLNWVDLKDKLKEFQAEKDFKDLLIPNMEENLIFLATKYKILTSLDSGDSWAEIKLITSEDKSYINSIAVNPQNAHEIYYATDTTFYRSLDGGQNWTPKKLPTARSGWKLLIDPDEPSIIYMGVKGSIK